MWYEDAHLVMEYFTDRAPHRNPPAHHYCQLEEYHRLGVEWTVPQGLNTSKNCKRIRHRQCSFWNLSIGESITVMGLPLSLRTALAGSARHRGMEAENTGSKSEGNALTRESSQSTHGTGTGLYKPSYLLNRHLNGHAHAGKSSIHGPLSLTSGSG